MFFGMKPYLYSFLSFCDFIGLAKYKTSPKDVLLWPLLDAATSMAAMWLVDSINDVSRSFFFLAPWSELCEIFGYFTFLLPERADMQIIFIGWIYLWTRNKFLGMKISYKYQRRCAIFYKNRKIQIKSTEKKNKKKTVNNIKRVIRII